jgi:hypothetical protein
MAAQVKENMEKETEIVGREAEKETLQATGSACVNPCGEPPIRAGQSLPLPL